MGANRCVTEVRSPIHNRPNIKLHEQDWRAIVSDRRLVAPGCDPADAFAPKSHVWGTLRPAVHVPTLTVTPTHYLQHS